MAINTFFIFAWKSSTYGATCRYVLKENVIWIIASFPYTTELRYWKKFFCWRLCFRIWWTCIAFSLRFSTITRTNLCDTLGWLNIHNIFTFEKDELLVNAASNFAKFITGKEALLPVLWSMTLIYTFFFCEVSSNFEISLLFHFRKDHSLSFDFSNYFFNSFISSSCNFNIRCSLLLLCFSNSSVLLYVDFSSIGIHLWVVPIPYKVKEFLRNGLETWCSRLHCFYYLCRSRNQDSIEKNYSFSQSFY